MSSIKVVVPREVDVANLQNSAGLQSYCGVKMNSSSRSFSNKVIDLCYSYPGSIKYYL